MTAFIKKTAILAFISSLVIYTETEPCYAIEYNLVAETPFTVGSVSTSDAFNFTVVPDRSYCLEMKTITGTPIAAIQSLTFYDADMTFTGRDRGDSTPPIYSPSIPSFTGLARKCFFVAGNPSNISNNRVRATITFSTGTTAGQTELRLHDTTLIGSFNTSVTDFNFLELTNTLTPTNRDNGVISGTIKTKNVITDAVVFSRAFSVNPGDRLDVNIHDAVGPRVFGIITVTHNGPNGSLKGYVSQYNIVTTNPLDFEPVVNQQMLRPSGLP